MDRKVFEIVNTRYQMTQRLNLGNSRRRPALALWRLVMIPLWMIVTVAKVLGRRRKREGTISRRD